LLFVQSAAKCSRYAGTCWPSAFVPRMSQTAPAP
jgi:hypothetical protein